MRSDDVDRFAMSIYVIWYDTIQSSMYDIIHIYKYDAMQYNKNKISYILYDRIYHDMMQYNMTAQTTIVQYSAL